MVVRRLLWVLRLRNKSGQESGWQCACMRDLEHKRNAVLDCRFLLTWKALDVMWSVWMGQGRYLFMIQRTNKMKNLNNGEINDDDNEQLMFAVSCVKHECPMRYDWKNLYDLIKRI